MKLNKIMVAVVIAFGLSSTVYANQGQGQVKFLGEIIDAPCSIAAGSEDQTVNLGQISKGALKNGGVSTPVDFAIQLESCDTDTFKTVLSTFTGAQDLDNTDLVGITGTAKGAGVAITYGGQPVIMNVANAAQSLNPGDNTLTFSAHLKGTKAVTPGDFTAGVNWTLEYK